MSEANCSKQKGQCKKAFTFPSLSLFSFFCLLNTTLSLVGNLGHLTQVRHINRKSSTTHSHQWVQYFRIMSKQLYGCQCLGFLTCPQMLMHAMTGSLCRTGRMWSDFLASHIYYNYYLQSFLDYSICHEQNNCLQKQKHYCHHQRKKNYRCFKHTQMQSLYMHELHTKIKSEHLDIYTEKNEVRMT